MKTIVVAASKGGVGKTTLAATLAVEATHHGSVAILDIDPQQSLARWHDVRTSSDENSVPHLIEVGKKPETAITRAKKQKLDWLFIDTPGGSLTLMKLAVEHADLIVIPTRPSPLDVKSLNPIVELCEIAGRPFVFILNGVTLQSAMTDGARNYLVSRYGHPIIEEMQFREAHAAAMLSGATAPELDAHGDAAAECRAVFTTIQRLANNPAELMHSRRKKSAS